MIVASDKWIVIDMQRAFVESGKARSSLKEPEFQNCEFPQLLVSDEYITPEIRLKNLLDFRGFLG